MEQKKDIGEIERSDQMMKAAISAKVKAWLLTIEEPGLGRIN